MAGKIKGLHFPNADERFSGPLATEEERRQRAAKYDAEIAEKLASLVTHYGISPGPAQFYELALALARDMYPEHKRAGRKTKWGDVEKGLLVVEIERLTKPGDTAHGVEWACRTLAKREPWASFVEAKDESEYGPTPAEALRKAYFGFREERWAAVSRDAFKWHETAGTIADWEKRVSDTVKNSDFE